MEENNRKGPGIFYAVTGVATLVVAIIGATFAFFSATATNNNVITGNTAEAAGITLTVTPVTATGTNMIPLNLKVGDGSKDTVDQFEPAMAGACRDINNNNVCQVYKIDIKNNSGTSTIDVRGSLQLSQAAANMKWQLLNVTNEGTGEKNTGFDASEISTYKMDDVTSVTTSTALGQIVRVGQEGTTGTGDTVRRTLAPGANSTYFVLFWLEEMGEDQKDDASKNFAGTVTFNAVDASGQESGITASFAS